MPGGMHPHAIVGDRVRHPARGDGVVCAIDRHHARPTSIQFDDGDLHSYSDASATKLLLVERPAPQSPSVRRRISDVMFGDDPQSPMSPTKRRISAMFGNDVKARPVQSQPLASPHRCLTPSVPLTPSEPFTPSEPLGIGDNEHDGEDRADSSSDRGTRPSSVASARQMHDVALPGTVLQEHASPETSGAAVHHGSGLVESRARGNLRRLSTMGSFPVSKEVNRSLRSHLTAQKAAKTVRYIGSLPHRLWWWLASWTSEGHFDVRMSPLIEDSKQKFWSMVTTLLLRQYLSGLVFGLLIAEPTCDLQLLALIILTLLHIAYLGIFKPMIDTVSLLFEIVTLSLQLAMLLILYAQFRDQPIDKSIPLMLLVSSVFFNVIFHFPATHYGLAGQTSLRMVAKQLVSLVGVSAKMHLLASSNALRSGALAASGRLFGGRKSHASQSERRLNRDSSDLNRDSLVSTEQEQPYTGNLGNVAEMIREDCPASSASPRAEKRNSEADLSVSDPSYIVGNLQVAEPDESGTDLRSRWDSIHVFGSLPESLARVSPSEADDAMLMKQSESESDAEWPDTSSDNLQPDSSPMGSRPSMRLSMMTRPLETTALTVNSSSMEDMHVAQYRPITPLGSEEGRFMDLRPSSRSSRPSSQPRASAPSPSGRHEQRVWTPPIAIPSPNNDL